MIRVRSLLTLGVLFAGGAVHLGLPETAEAAFKVRISTDGGATWGTAVSDGDALDVSGVTGEIAVSYGAFTLKAASTNGIDPNGSYIDVTITGSAGTANVGTVYNLAVQASMDGVNTVPSPQHFTMFFTSASSMDTTIAGGGYKAQTWINNSNSLFDTAGAALDSGVQLPGASGVPVFADHFVGTAPYSVTAQVNAKFKQTLSGALSLDSNNVIAPAPAPAGLVLVAGAVPFLGLGAWIRRKRLAS